MVSPLVMTSREAATQIPDRSLDLVFLDGDHSYASTAEDIAQWLPKLRPGGVLCGHDCEGPLSDFDAESLYAARNEDFIHLEGFRFAGVHPGVVLAVHEAFQGRATLWALRDLLAPGLSGRSSIWSITPGGDHG